MILLMISPVGTRTFPVKPHSRDGRRPCLNHPPNPIFCKHWLGRHSRRYTATLRIGYGSSFGLLGQLSKTTDYFNNVRITREEKRLQASPPVTAARKHEISFLADLRGVLHNLRYLQVATTCRPTGVARIRRPPTSLSTTVHGLIHPTRILRELITLHLAIALSCVVQSTCIALQVDMILLSACYHRPKSHQS